MTAKIKLNAASGGGSFSLQAPSSSSNNRVITLPDIADGTLLTSSSGVGITEADSWDLTTTYTASSGTDTTEPVTNLARSSFTGFGYLGSGMTESSGVFTFPSTGFYLVTAQFMINIQSNRAAPQEQVEIRFTTDNSTYTDASKGRTFGEDYSDSRYSTITISALLDITNVSTHKVRFKTIMSNTTRVIGNNTIGNATNFKFIRLGDT
tara:strand:+ start:161 stop:784 length:624 start_codon:yes stop_codon:yes gene_type:complete